MRTGYVMREEILCVDFSGARSNPSDIELLVSQNPFAEKIKFLINNMHLAKVPVADMFGELRPPNCIGTALFIAGVGRFEHPYHGYDTDLSETLKHPRLSVAVPGSLCLFYSRKADDWHVGVYLGIYDDQHTLFAQQGPGGDFALESLLGNYASPAFYLPRTLLKS